MQHKTLLDELRGRTPLVSVGILTADLMSLGSELALLEQASAKLVHIDVMDGCFCPMMTVGPPLIKAMKTPLLKDVHLMIQEPLEKIESFVAAGADIITVHIESCRQVHRVLQVLGEKTCVNDPNRGILRSVALNPSTSLELVGPLLDELDMVVLLAVNPGWSGQKFIAATESRLTRLKQMIQDSKKDVLIGVDGGVTRDNIAEVARMGADIIVTGSAVFDGKAALENAEFMINAVNNAAVAS